MARPDPRKLKDEAAEAVARGKWRKALECYLALESIEPRDGLWPQKAGEAFRRLDRRGEAIAAFDRAAEVYSRNGFLLKAIAVCKLILEIAPGHTATQARLAALHSARGMPAAPVASSPAPVVTAPQPAPTPRIVEAPAGAPVVEFRTLPRGAPLEQVSLGTVVPGARPSADLASVSSVPVFEIPLDDADLEFVAEEWGDEGTEAELTARAILPRTPLFSALDAGRLRLLIDRVRLVRLEAGAVLFEQGAAGVALYVIAGGEMAVRVRRNPSEPPIEVARLGEGAFFGEIALLTDQPRSATLAATAATDLLEINRDAIGDLIQGSPEVLRVLLGFLRDRLLDTLVGTSPLFAPLGGPERLELAARFRFFETEPGATLLEQGKGSPALFILLAWRTTVVRDGRELGALRPGDIFGEQSLLEGGPAPISVRAASRVFALGLPRADFGEVVTTHPQVLAYVNKLAEARRTPTGVSDGHLRIV